MAERVARAAGPAPMMQTSHLWWMESYRMMMTKIWCEEKHAVVVSAE